MLDSRTVSLSWSSLSGYQRPLPTPYVTQKLPLVTADQPDWLQVMEQQRAD